MNTDPNQTECMQVVDPVEYSDFAFWILQKQYLLKKSYMLKEASQETVKYGPLQRATPRKTGLKSSATIL